MKKFYRIQNTILYPWTALAIYWGVWALRREELEEYLTAFAFGVAAVVGPVGIHIFYPQLMGAALVTGVIFYFLGLWIFLDSMQFYRKRGY